MNDDDGTEPTEDAPRPRKRKRSSAGVGQTIGGMLAGFDHQIFRSTPPPHELVKKGDTLPSVAASDGGTLTIDIPEPDVPES